MNLAPAGTPDLVCLGPGGATVWLEVKSATGKPRRSQVAMHSTMRHLGHRVHTVRTVSQAVDCCVVSKKHSVD
jgi:hypothetical protein